jgi:hypothetical protein
VTFISGTKTLVNLARDAQGIAFPAVGSSRLVAINRNRVAAKMLYGDQRGALIDNANRIDSDYLRDLQTYIWKLGYVQNGYPGLEFIFNLGIGTANNVVQHTDYEILQVDPANSRRLQLWGPDPRAVGVAVSVPNPAWPAEGEPRLLSLPGSNRLPIGSSVLFSFPSCLFGRLNPYIEDIEPPGGAVGGIKAFWVLLSHSARYCRHPWDRAFPPADGKYRCRIYSYLVAPEGWDNYQPATPEAQFALAVQEYFPGAIEGGVIELLDSDGDSCRCLLPAFGEVIKARLVYTTGAEAAVPSPASRLRTVDLGVNSWRTTLDLSGLELADLEKVVVSYWPEACSTDETIINARGRCAFAQDSLDGYGDADGFVCTNTICDKYRAGEFGGKTCWAPEATGFQISRSQEADTRRFLHSKFWSAEPLTLVQGGTPGQIGSAASSHRNFAFNRNNTTSIQSVVGGFFTGSLRAISQAYTESWFGPSMGARRTFTDDDGRPWHELVFGWYENQKGTAAGIANVGGWSSRKNVRGLTATGTDAVYPLHRGPSCSLATFALSEDPSPWIRLARLGDEETIWADDIERDRVDPATAARVREIFG